MFGKKHSREEAVAPQPAGFGHRTREQIEEALGMAHETRKQRAALMRDVKAGKVTLEDILTGNYSSNEIARGTQVRSLLRALPGIGTATVNRLIDKMEIPEGRKVRGLGVHQRAALIEWRSQNMPAEGQE